MTADERNVCSWCMLTRMWNGVRLSKHVWHGEIKGPIWHPFSDIYLSSQTPATHNVFIQKTIDLEKTAYLAHCLKPSKNMAHMRWSQKDGMNTRLEVLSLTPERGSVPVSSGTDNPREGFSAFCNIINCWFPELYVLSLLTGERDILFLENTGRWNFEKYGTFK